MRLMHNTYLFIYIMGACIGSLVSSNLEGILAPTKAFRLECLTRLYIGYLLHELARSLNSVILTEDLSFEFW
jgi:hypothetical protein